MRTYLLTWHPEPAEENQFSAIARRIARNGKPVKYNWNTGKRKQMTPGEPVYPLRQGSEPRGVFGVGRVNGTPWEGPHWKQPSKRAIYVDILIDDLVDPASEPVITVRQLSQSIPKGNWEPRASGQKLDAEVADQLRLVWDEFRGANGRVPAPSDDVTAFEGQLRRAYIKHRRRERVLRAAKLLKFRRDHGGRLFCEVPGCGFDFGRACGSVAANYAQVHHLTPLRAIAGRTPTSVDDLAVVCANCHAVIHLGGNCRTLREVGRLISIGVKRLTAASSGRPECVAQGGSPFPLAGPWLSSAAADAER